MRVLSGHPNLGCFLIAYFLVLFLTPYIILLANKFKVMDMPSARKVHTEPVARLGGVVIAISFFVAVLSTLEYNLQLLSILGTSLIIILIGVVDDVRNVSALFKLFILFAAATYLIQEGMVFTAIKLPLMLAVLITLFWFAYLSSCFNAIDNMNGLCCGTAAISSLMFYFISGQTGQFYMGYIAIALCASCLAFLRFNFWSAQIFLGDSGSFFIGFILAAVAVMGKWGTHAEPLKGAIVPLLILWLPLYDLLLTTTLRIRGGQVKGIRGAIALSAKDHISHRLQNVFKLSSSTTVLILYALSFVFGYLGVIARLTEMKFSLTIFIGVIIFSVYFGYLLSKSEVEY